MGTICNSNGWGEGGATTNFGAVAERIQVARLIHVSDDDEVIQAPEGACCVANRVWHLMWRHLT